MVSEKSWKGQEMMRVLTPRAILTDSDEALMFEAALKNGR